MNEDEKKAEFVAKMLRESPAVADAAAILYEATASIMDREIELEKIIARNNSTYLIMMAATFLNLANLCWNLVH